MTTIEARVLSALAPGGHLTVDQIARHTDLSADRVRKGAQALRGRGLATSNPGLHGDAWALTARGKLYVDTPTGRAVLDFPSIAS
ncbi:MarR family transcriptional regulator [Nocardia sp. NPDC005978]|uniref:MarR family transcriptional regulator n=1 Tax=unclassified Nocardia TaxID=2637762 RepID=UPI00339EE631